MFNAMTYLLKGSAAVKKMIGYVDLEKGKKPKKGNLPLPSKDKSTFVMPST